MQAGIRTKDLAFFIIFARFVLPVVIGVTAVLLLYVLAISPNGRRPPLHAVSGLLVGSYKAPDIWLKNKVNKRSAAIRKGLPDALDLLVICAEAGLTVDAAFGRVSASSARPIPSLATNSDLPRSNSASSTSVARRSRTSPSASTSKRCAASSRP